MDLTREFTDQMTGAVLERPGLERALVEARARRSDLLLISVQMIGGASDKLDQAAQQQVYERGEH
jgi:hypothetical protein